VKRKILAIIFFFPFLLLTFSSNKHLGSKELSPAKNSTADPQNEPAKKPKYDYMSTYLSSLSRNTKPLGLKEDLVLKKLMKQPGIKWAIRSGKRHILQ
jgi:hypothetical protein